MKTNLKKDMMRFYMFRNALTTFLIALIALMMSLMNYYRCDMVEALQRIGFVNVYTTVYFLLIWLFDYLVFEMSKILYDVWQKKASIFLSFVLIMLAIGIFFIDIIDVFQWNFCLLCLLIVVRQFKEMWSKHVHQKRP